VNSTKRIKFPK